MSRLLTLPVEPCPRKATTGEPSGVVVSALTTSALVAAACVKPGGSFTLDAADAKTAPFELSTIGASTIPPPLGLPSPTAITFVTVGFVDRTEYRLPFEAPIKRLPVLASRTGPVNTTLLPPTDTPEALHPFVVARASVGPEKIPVNLKSRPLSFPAKPTSVGVP